MIAGVLALAAAGFVAPSEAWASNAPRITVAGPSGTVTTSSTTLSYTINRGGSQVAGLTCSLTGPVTRTACGTVVTVQGSTDATVALSGLTNGTYTYAVDLALTDGGDTSASTTFTVSLPVLTVSMDVNDLGGDVTPFPSWPTTLIVDGGAENLLEAQVANAPAAGVTYRWTIITPSGQWLVNPDQTTASVSMPAFSVPFFTRETVEVDLTVTTNDDSAPPITVRGRMDYRNSALTVAAATSCQDPPIQPTDSANTISTAGSLTITQHATPSSGPRDENCPVNVDDTTSPTGTVTYTTETGQVLGTTGPLGSLVVDGSTLGVGTHTLISSYSFTWGDTFAYAAIPIPVTVS